ncbi:hypothetical protein OF83DRAFT_1126444 [Amylostereum chailletii]|nr:hypothetical protein OF83DRAFT_1126444 [Amylostereum chailletii]
MATDATKQRAKLSTLDTALDDLEKELEPLFAQTLPETVLRLDTIQQAKLQVVLPYLVYDLVFIYLKTRGLDPKSHPVLAELDRIKQYFEKIKSAEQPDQRAPIDKDAASRFIKHAINQVKYNTSSTPAEGSSSTGPKTHVTFDDNGKPVPIRVTEKMRERERYQAALREDASDEEEDADIAVIDDVPSEDDEDAEPEVQPSRSRKDAKGKGKATAPLLEKQAQAGSKRRRPLVDPFAGFGDDGPSASSPSSSPKKKPKKKLSDESTDSPMADSVASSGRNTPQLNADTDKKGDKRTKKVSKKRKDRPLSSGE